MNYLGKHIIDIDHIDRNYIENIFSITERLKTQNELKKSFDNKNICTLFFEDSTRTRLSFEKASNNLKANFHNLDLSTSSVNKGESFFNTIKTVESIGMDIYIIRHGSSGASIFAAKNLKGTVINAGDGSHAHPTQALSDLFTIKEQKKDFTKLEISIVGDFLFSRVARSNVLALLKMGSKVNILGPPELTSPQISDAYDQYNSLYPGNLKFYNELKQPLINSDIIMALRIQKERFNKETKVDLENYKSKWRIDTELLDQCKKNILIMHPGPMNEELEISHNVAHSDFSLIDKQVENGVFVRQSIIQNIFEGED